MEPRLSGAGRSATRMGVRPRHRRVDPGEKFLPVSLDRGIETPFYGVVLPRARFMRLFAKGHPRLGDTFPTFSVVARLASGDYVVPDMQTTSRARYHVIDGEIRPLPIAILTRVSIADENLPTCQLHARPRSPDEIHEADDGWSGEHGGNARHSQRFGFKDFSLAANHQP